MDSMDTQAHPEQYRVVVVYNGDAVEERTESTAALEPVYQKALKHFQLQGQTNLTLVYAGRELDLHGSLASQNVPNNSTLSLQPRVVRNG